MILLMLVGVSVDSANENDMYHVDKPQKQWGTVWFHPNPLPQSMQYSYVQLSGTNVPRTKPDPGL